jgi:hypothetical protein
MRAVFPARVAGVVLAGGIAAGSALAETMSFRADLRRSFFCGVREGE